MHTNNFIGFSNSSISLLDVLVAFAYVAIFFFIIREVIMWYWKINKIIDLLEKIEENTRPVGKKLQKEDSILDHITHP